MKQLVLNIILIVISLSLFGQGNSGDANRLLDSLKEKLEFIHDDSSRVQMLLQLADVYRNRNPDTTTYYSMEALRLSKKIKDISGEMGAMAFMGQALMNKGNLPEALKLGLESVELGEGKPVRLSGGVGPNYSNLGVLYMQIGHLDKAIQYFRRMIALGGDDMVGVAYGNYQLALAYENLGQMDSSIEYLKKSYQKFSALHYSYYPKIYDVYPPWYNLRAKIYLKQNKPQLALKDLFTVLRMTLRCGDITLISNTYIDISNYYNEFNQKDSSIFYAEKAFDEATKISYIKGLLGASEILAKQFETTDPVKALYYYKLATETRNKLYGAGNIQVMRDMIDREEKKQAEIEATKAAYQNKLRVNAIMSIALFLLGFAVFLFIIIRRKQKAKQKIESAFNQLKSTQAQLIQSEKMASLGELTAGIAHEIQNPLNFVNNFSEVNRELIDEMQQEMDKGNLNDAKEISNDIKENEEKISHHGKRADAIVKGMLQHSRTSTGKKELTDINALCDEYLRLSYHGMRAKDKSFNAEMKTEFDASLGKVNVISQDIGRVLLNLFNNAFYAVSERSRNTANERLRQAQPDIIYEPIVSVKTKRENNHVIITVTDNGGGIPEKIKDKIFQPFFTTKPTGSGTGLGLSLSYDIVKAHGGEIKVNSTVDEGTKFVLDFPIS